MNDQWDTLESRCMMSAYAMTEFGLGSDAISINAKGQLLVAATPKDLVYNPNAKNQYVAKLLSSGGTTTTNLGDLNAAGVVAGRTPFGGSAHAALWFLSSKGKYSPVDLGVLPTGNNSFAKDVNATNVAVGFSNFPADPTTQHAILATYHKGVAHLNDMNTLATGRGNVTLVEGWDVTDTDLIAIQGYATGSNVYRAYRGLYANGAISILALPALGATGSGVPQALNEAGVVVGNSSLTPTSPSLAVRWTVGKKGAVTTTNLGALGGESSSADGINKAGDIVGSADFIKGATDRPHGFLWTPTKNGKGTMTDLNTFMPKNSGLTIVQAMKITDSGIIFAKAQDAKFNLHAVVLRPTSVPAIPAATPAAITATPPAATPFSASPELNLKDLLE